MSDEQWRAFVSEGTRTAKLSTVRGDGSPHVVPVWFILDGDDLVFNTGKGSVKAQNLARDPRASVCVDDEHPPFAFTVLRGRAEFSENPGDLLDVATRIGARYMGRDRAGEYGRRNSEPGELLVRLRIDQVLALSGIAD
jgi:PPOX class probable F420-dependent enzyme